MNVFLQRILYQLLILAVPLLLYGQTSILIETVENTPVEYNFSSSPMSPGTMIAPSHGVHSIVASGGFNNYKLTYTPNDGFFGQDFIRVTRWTCPIISQCFQFLDFYITVVPAKVTARQDNVGTNVNTSVSINVLSNDYSSRGVLVLNSISSVNNGTASFSSGSPNIQFNPTPGFEGVALLNYIVCDDENNCDNGNVSIHVKGANSPASDTVRVFTHKNTPQVLLIPPGFQRSSGPNSGSYGVTDGDLPEYTPNNNFTGLDYIHYSNGARQIVARINVLNTNFNLFAKDDAAYTTPGVPVEFNVLQNDAFGTTAIYFNIVKQPDHGSLVLGAENGLVTYIPDPGFFGTDSFRYSSRRPFGAANTETATATVFVSNFEPSAATYRMSTPKHTPLVISNNVPVPNFQFFVTDQPDRGTVLLLQGEVDTVIYGRPIKGYNMVIYVPNNDAVSGEDEFEIAFCISSDTGSGCTFMRTVKIEIEILNIGVGNEPMCFADCIWTGDTNFDGIVDMADLLPIGLFMGQAGLPRPDNNPALWYGKYGDNWEDPFSDYFVDLKHLDADGNGYVSALDTAAIHNFYGRTHSITASIAPLSNYTIGLSGNIFAGPGDVVELKMILGTPAQPALNVYGFTFPFGYNPNIFVPNSVQIGFSHSGWLGYNSPILYMNRNNVGEGRLETGFTRTTGVAASGHGEIGTVRFVIRDDLVGIRMSDEALSVEVGGGLSTMMNSAGQSFGVEIEKANIIIRYNQAEEPLNEDHLKVWPNPVGDYLNVHLNGGKEFERIVVYNLMGQIVFNSGNMKARSAQIGVDQLPNGIYVLSVRTPEGLINKKFEVLKR